MLDLILLHCLQDNPGLRFINILGAPISQASLWFATLLRVCCKKIMTSNTIVYLRLKQKANSLSFWCFLGYLWSIFYLQSTLAWRPVVFQGNSCVPRLLLSCRSVFRLTAGRWLPFMLFLIPSWMLIFSLYRHHRKMNVHVEGRRDAWAQAHVTALKSLGCFPVLRLVYMVTNSFSVTSEYPDDLTRVLIPDTFLDAHPSIYSVLGIPRGSRLFRELCRRQCVFGEPGARDLGEKMKSGILWRTSFTSSLWKGGLFIETFTSFILYFLCISFSFNSNYMLVVNDEDETVPVYWLWVLCSLYWLFALVELDTRIILWDA